jgi:hypothetical protein
MKNVKIDYDLTVLTAEQTAQVAGGLLYSPAPPIGTVCRTCTSGTPIQFQAEIASLAK